MFFARPRRLGLLLAALLLVPSASSATELAAVRLERPLGGDNETYAVFSEQTLTLAVSVDRDQAELIAYTVKSRPFVRPLSAPSPRAYDIADPLQLEVVMLGPNGGRHTERKEVGPLCFAHGPDAEPHVAGDTILVHRESFLVELPLVEGWDRFDLAYYDRGQGTTLRRALGTRQLSPAQFRPSPQNGLTAPALGSDDDPPASPRASTLLWPEDYSDPDVYRIWGDPAASAERVNVVIVPDGYTYAQKSLMESHAQAMIDRFHEVTPYKEHDGFINYTLVYAYSLESGTDQCDCDVIKDTAMGTRFPEPNPSCGHSDNRCLYYGGGCDTAAEGNIVQAEMRAPAQDETIVMVNTTRYGGCGGARSVYSAANSSAVDIAVHELGHSWGGLADEYAYNVGCGSGAGGVNTSLDGVNGAWPEWVDDLGAPREGAQYWQSCIFRAQNFCAMRESNRPFCAVCNQHWSLKTFGHPRVAPTAPIRSMTPSAQTTAFVGVPAQFSLETRLSVGPLIENDITWLLYPPGSTLPTFVNSDTATHTHTFTSEGTWELVATVVADVNFVKPSRFGANRGSVTWEVEVGIMIAPGEISPPDSSEPLVFEGPGELTWSDGSDGSVATFNLYRGALGQLGATGYGECHQPDLEESLATVAEDPEVGTAWFYLVTGVNPAGEGPLGVDSSGTIRPNVAPCAP